MVASFKYQFQNINPRSKYCNNKCTAYHDIIVKRKSCVENKSQYQNFDRYMQTQRQQYEGLLQNKRDAEKLSLQEKRMEQDNQLASEMDKLTKPDIRNMKLR